MFELDTGKSHQPKRSYEAQPHQENRHEPVSDIGKQDPHDNDHEEHRCADQDTHVLCQSPLDISWENAGTPGDGHRCPRGRVRRIHNGMEVVQSRCFSLVRQTFTDLDLDKRHYV